MPAISIHQLSMLADGLSWLMQLSILVPMVVVWQRRRYFSAPVRLLSWYVYLSLLCAMGARTLEALRISNWMFLIVFNVGKIVLLTAVYLQILQLRWVRLGLALLAGAGLLVAAYALAMQDFTFLLPYARTLQCGVLAAFALAYLEQLSREPPASSLRSNPIFLLSVGQLIYSALTVMYFSFDLTRLTHEQSRIFFLVVVVATLFFNAFLTLAFLRAQPHQPPAFERR